MLNKAIHTYQTAKLSAIRKFANHDYDILDEPGFLDDGYIRMKIEGLKMAAKKIDQELEQLLQFDKKDEYHKQKVAHFIEQKEVIHLHIAFLASNSFNSVEFARHLIRPIEIDFDWCLQALVYYKEQQESEALSLFEKYFSQQTQMLEHYLINKIYGLLLLKNQHWDQAAIFLRKAAEKRPEDQEIHRALIQVYQARGQFDQVQVHESILQMLGGDPFVNHILSK